MLNRLQAGAGTYACGGYLAGLGSLQRSEICTALLFSRLERKMRMVDALREEASENWNQTFYLLYFRTTHTRSTWRATSNTWRPNTTSNRWRPESGNWTKFAPPTIPYCVWRRRRSSSYRTNS